MMEGENLPEGERIAGTVKAAVSSYGQRITQGISTVKKFETNLPEVSTKEHSFKFALQCSFHAEFMLL